MLKNQGAPRLRPGATEAIGLRRLRIIPLHSKPALVLVQDNVIHYHLTISIPSFTSMGSYAKLPDHNHITLKTGGIAPYRNATIGGTVAMCCSFACMLIFVGPMVFTIEVLPL